MYPEFLQKLRTMKPATAPPAPASAATPAAKATPAAQGKGQAR
jgi:hypothetical protein